MNKAILVLSVLILILANACTKNHEVPQTALEGKWKLTESMVDPGNGGGKWMKVPEKSPYEFVTFSGTGKIESNVFGEYTEYSLKDSTTLSFKRKNNTIQNYLFAIDGKTLTMSPAGPILCIEGCAIRFSKVED